MTKYIKEQGFRGSTRVRIYETEVPSYEGRLALEFISHLALSALQPDGEDTAGRQKMRLLGVAEAVQRGCELAAETVKEFRVRGWMVALPDIEPEQLDPTP